MNVHAAYLNPRLLNPSTWKAKKFVLAFFGLDIAFFATSVVASIFISFYRPFLVFIFTIINGCLLVFALYALILFKTSSNRLNIVLYYHFYRLLFFAFVLAFSIYELVTISTEANGFFLSRLYLCPFLYFVCGLLYETLSILLSLFLIATCYRAKRGREVAGAAVPVRVELSESEADPF